MRRAYPLDLQREKEREKSKQNLSRQDKSWVYLFDLKIKANFSMQDRSRVYHFDPKKQKQICPHNTRAG